MSSQSLTFIQTLAVDGISELEWRSKRDERLIVDGKSTWKDFSLEWK